jgi:hypothetical protein
MRALWSKFVIWVMDVGLITILLQKFKLDNTDHQKSLSELIIILQQMFGLSLAQFSK